MKRTRFVRPRQPQDTHSGAANPRRPRVTLPIFLLLVVVAAIGFDVWSQERTFAIFGRTIAGATVNSIVVQSQIAGTGNASASVVGTVSQHEQVLHLLNLLSQARLSKQHYQPRTGERAYVVSVKMYHGQSAVYSMYRIHRFPLEVIAVVGKRTYICPGPLARALQGLTR